MQQIVPVKLGSRSYDIHIGAGVSAQIADVLKQQAFFKRGMIVTDQRVSGLYLRKIRKTLSEAGYETGEYILPPGETSKTLSYCEKVLSQMAKDNLERNSFIIALGGGVIGDLAGFVASCYLRGIRFVHIPTTLLAMVDSSVGGKTGVNLPEGKNLVGAFYQPVSVLADLDMLKSLSDREFSAGMAEVIKYGVIRDKPFFYFLEKNIEKIKDKDLETLTEIVKRCCEIKAEVVSEDEHETTGLREILNFGHTIGHGIEAVGGYGKLLHGEAIAVGMVLEAKLAAEKLGFSADASNRLRKLLEAFDLPTKIPAVDKGLLLRSMARDKKVRDGKLRFSIPEDFGATATGIEFSEDEVRRVI
ncbi:MAG: 3-dehydroquinate synthase [Verrucomicrobiota bacterium]|nr:3-dehydroquinate synthase [Verrucomicrobiota bacterium]